MFIMMLVYIFGCVAMYFLFLFIFFIIIIINFFFLGHYVVHFFVRLIFRKLRVKLGICTNLGDVYF
jgi:hypothetical protein